MDISKRNVFFISITYGIIVIFANICGILVPNLFQSSDYFTQNMDGWVRFLNDHKLTSYTQFLSFGVPTVGCILYTISKKFDSHFVNFPLAYSAIGITGWITFLLEEIVFMCVGLASGYEINIKALLVTFLMNTALESIVTFALSFFVMETIHRKFVLPKYFPEGHLNQITGVHQPSVKLLFTIVYIAVTVFPILYLLVYCLDINKIDSNTFIVLFFIIAIGLVISLAFTSYFERPINKLKIHGEKIKEGDYKSHVQIVTNDSFGELADTMNDMVDSISQKNQKIRENLNLTITRMAIMVESRDNSTGGHIKRTSDCVKVFVDELKKNPKYADLSESFFQNVIKAAPMHDLGKIAVKDSILQKKGKFTDEEYEQMKHHAAEGARIVEAILESEEDEDFKKIAVNIAHFHHERWDGNGYPTKISGESIPLEARIMALADVFDALVSKRCYKESMSYDESFKIIEESLGTHFDPDLGREFIKLRQELEALYNTYTIV